MGLLKNGILCLLGLFLVSAQSYARIIYVHTDHLGSVIAESDASGELTKRYHYQPFGLPLENQADNQPSYTGHTYDDELKLNYMKARFYDPEIGRFYSPDLIGFTGNPHSFKRYIYANNSPLKYTDPTGKYAELPLEALSIGVGSHSFLTNIGAGNYLGASIDILGIGFDIFASAIPGLPGVASVGIASLRNADSAGAFLYRGVSSGHPELSTAMAGRVIPGDIDGIVSAEAHNLGGAASASPFTSWTRDIDIALSHANKDGVGGVLLRVPEGAPSQFDSWSWEASPDVWYESEVLLRGMREGVDVFNSIDNFGGF